MFVFHPGIITPYLEYLALVKVQAQIIVQTDVSRGEQALEIPMFVILQISLQHSLR